MPDADEPIDPATARLVARMRRLMLISGLTTLVGIAAVLGVIGYRVLKNEERTAAPADVIALLPKGARILSTAANDHHIVITIETGGTIEIRSFNLKTMLPEGRLRFKNEP